MSNKQAHAIAPLFVLPPLATLTEAAATVLVAVPPLLLLLLLLQGLQSVINHEG